MVVDPLEFFRAKKPWSKYKDQILAYYLKPYLAKVARLRSPITIVDCFAGAGTFDDGEPGSPLIILQALAEAATRGASVRGVFIEREPVLVSRLEQAAASSSVRHQILPGDFHDHIEQLSSLARHSTVFLYVDPFKPSDLKFSDLSSVYSALSAGNSVEVLLNLQSRGFYRAASAAVGALEGMDDDEYSESLEERKIEEIAGGAYWRECFASSGVDAAERVERFVAGYCRQLERWFPRVLHCPIMEKYEHKLAKYHLVFGSRHPDAVDLMNGAMVKAKREFLGAQFGESAGFLFDTRPEKEVVQPEKVDSLITAVARQLGKVTWRELRVGATIRAPGKFNESEFNESIKRCIRNRRVNADCDGRKIEPEAKIWPRGDSGDRPARA